jgi:PAS domain S-box-containing protein
MMTIPGYKLDEKLYQGSQTVIYRARCRRDDQPVVLKILHKELPAPEEIARFQREFEIISSLEIGGVIKAIELNRSRANLIMVLEDFGGESLARLKELTALTLTLKEFLHLALRVTDILGDIHWQSIIHKDINPSHIVWNRASGEVKLIDFGISTVLPRETTDHTTPDALAGTLAYMSPEQTGRMNRSTDYRTDFYSLGVTFYELLTSQLPFPGTDPLELVHAHIAKIPDPPHRIRPGIPGPVSEIVLKLMAKNAEDRYQGAHGLKHDLQQCLDRLNAEGKIPRFEIGKTDYPEIFQVPQELYGREKEIETLLQGFERVCGGTTEMMLVTGYPGIGKTSLVRELLKTITGKQGFFISGKFDQLQRNIPYAPFIQAFRLLVRHILTGTGKQVTAWKERIMEAVGVNGQVIIDVIPDVELVIGKQPPVPDLLPVESQNRFHHVLENFVRVLAGPGHPLTIFLDDLQWIDLPSLKLVELMVTAPGTRNLFFIGAFRDNEVDPMHPLMLSLKGLKERGCRIASITLPALGPAQVNRLIADALHCGIDAAKPLASLCIQKTGGNPFFLNQFLQTLDRKHLLEFDRKAGEWRWKLREIQQAGLTDNVVEFMVTRLQQLPADTREVLKIAAVIGLGFSLKILSLTIEKTYWETAGLLWEALREQFILPTDERYSFAGIRDQSEFEALAGHARYRFSHDRVHQAAYTLAAPGEKVEIHAKIGRLMLEHLSPAERHERLFDMVNHLDAGIKVITRPDEKIELAKLNLLAARKARYSVAYPVALEYAGVGMELLGEEGWQDHYESMLDLHRERALLEYLNGNIDKSRYFIDIISTQAKTGLEKAEIYNLLMVLYTMSGSYAEAIGAGKDALRLLGMEVPGARLPAAAEKEIAAIKEKLGNRDIASLIREPGMTDPVKKIAMNILMNMDAPSYYTDQEVFAFVSALKVRLSLEYGHVPASCAGYYAYGVICGAAAGDYRTGYAFGRLALQLSEKFHDLGQKCKTSNVLANYLNSWVRHIKESEAINEEGYQAGLNAGELEYAGYILGHILYSDLFQGKNLEYIAKKNENYLEFLQKTKNLIQVHGNIGLKMVIGNLRGETAGKLCFDTGTITDREHIERGRRYQTFTTLCDYYIFKSQVLYLYREHANALESILKAGELLSYVVNRFVSAQHNFYYSLILAGLYPGAAEDKKKEYRDRLDHNQKQMKKWADHCPGNFRHKYLLVEAESARIQGKNWPAADWYDQAIEAAGKNEFRQDETLANELAARFWLEKGKTDFARIYMERAYYGYRLWGAKRKLEDLEEKYPQLLPLSPGSAAEIARQIDVSSLMKATRYLSAEIVLSHLLEKMMQLIMENAGAQKGLFVLDHENRLFIELECWLDSDIQQMLSIPVEEASTPGQPASLIRWVARTRENLVLNNAGTEGDFTADPYIVKNKPQSVLCVPIIHQGKLTGIIYLENNLTPGAFTADRLEVIDILSAQAAVSIENARLYENLEAKVNERTGQLRGEKERVEMIFDIAGVIMVTLDSRQQVQRINKKGCEVLGYAAAEIIGKNWFDTFVPAPDRERTRAGFKQLMAGEIEPVEYFENLVLAKTGEERLVAWHNTVLRDKDGNITGTLSSAEDITQRRRAEEELKAALREKEILLKEIHHRVKNNLQIASSLLSLQAFNIEDERLVNVLNDSIKRINSMAEIHKLLYETESLARISFDRYLREISSNWHDTYADKSPGIRIKPGAKNIFLDIEKAIPCALIVNELLSNAFKYAFHGKQTGEIKVRLYEKDDGYTLIVSDNGVGFPKDLDLRSAGSLGMTIVKNLTAQLRGEMHLEQRKGAAITVTFPKSSPGEKERKKNV